VPQLVVSTSDLQSRIDRWLRWRRCGKQKRTRRHSIARPDLSSDYEGPRDDTERATPTSGKHCLDDSIGIHDDFFALGGHSLLAIATHLAPFAIFSESSYHCQVLRAPTIFASLAELVHESIAQRDREKVGTCPEEIELLSNTESRCLTRELQYSTGPTRQKLS